MGNDKCGRSTRGLQMGSAWTYRADGTGKPRLMAVQREHHFEIAVNGTTVARTTCTPESLEDLAVGRLLSTGLIASYDDVAAVAIRSGGAIAEVTLAEGAAQSDEGLLSSSRSRCSLADASLPVEWDPAQILRLAEIFERDSPMHRATGGAHSCYLARADRVLCCYEDLGRHNAFDKVLGWALRKNVDLGRCIVLTSGRIPTDMLSKAVRAGVPVLASKTVPTDKAIDLARKCGVTLLCSVSSTGFDVFNGFCPAGERSVLSA